MRDDVRTLFEQVGQDQVSHLRVLLPDARGHRRNGKRSLKVRRNLLLSLFLEEGKGHHEIPESQRDQIKQRIRRLKGSEGL